MKKGTIFVLKKTLKNEIVINAKCKLRKENR